MAKQQDLVVKMTINSQNFDKELKNAKSSMNQFSVNATNVGKSFNSVMGSMVKKIGLVGIALAAKDGFKQFMTSTEQMADDFQNEMGAMSDSWKSFLFQVNNGNLQGFQDVIDYARQARQALDELGDAAALFGLDYGSASAKATELLSTIQKKRKSGQDYSQEMTDYNALVDQLRQDNKLANEKSLKALEGMFGQKGIAIGDYGVSYMEAARLARQSAAGAFSDVNALNKAYAANIDISEVSDFSADLPASRVDELRKAWGSSRFNRAQFLRTLGNIPTEDKEAIEKVLSEISQRDNAVASMEKALNRYLTNEGGGGGGGPTTKATASMTEQQVAEYIARSAVWESLNADREKDSVIVDIELEDEDIVEPELDELMVAVAFTQERMQQLAKDTAAAMTAANALAGAFTAFGDVSDGTLGKVSKGLGGIISQVVATAQAMMVLTGKETLEGVADVFANTQGDVWVKLAAAGIALSGILGILATAKNSFAGSYAGGGIVGGSSYSGDKLWARVNSGEMILNKAQQQALATGGGQVKFVIEGSQLKGVLQNYETIENI